jgi:voltage-gated potassium channel
MRAFKLIRYSKSLRVVVDVLSRKRQALLAVLGLAVAYILISALVVFNVEPNTFRTLFDAIYWAVISLTTVGYGDIYPTTMVGRTVAMISSLMGVAVVALPSSIITVGLLEELHTEAEM